MIKNHAIENNIIFSIPRNKKIIIYSWNLCDQPKISKYVNKNIFLPYDNDVVFSYEFNPHPIYWLFHHEYKCKFTHVRENTSCHGGVLLSFYLHARHLKCISISECYAVLKEYKFCIHTCSEGFWRLRSGTFVPRKTGSLALKACVTMRMNMCAHLKFYVREIMLMPLYT